MLTIIRTLYTTSLIFGVGLFLLLYSGHGWASQRQPLADFSSLPFFSFPDLSPNGTKLAFRLNLQGRSMVAVNYLDNNNDFYTVAVEDKQRINWMHWLSNDRLLISFRMLSDRYSSNTFETRLAVFDANKRKLKTLFNLVHEDFSWRNVVQIQDDVIDFLPDEPDKFLLVKREKGKRERSVFKVDAVTGRSARVHRGTKRIHFWQADAKQRIRFGWGYSRNDGGFNAKAMSNEGKWYDLSQLVEQEKHLFRVLRFDHKQPDLLHVLSDHEGGYVGLYHFDVIAGEFREKIAGRNDAHISDVGYDHQGQITVIHYDRVQVESVYHDKDLKLLVRSLGRAFPAKTVHIASSTPDRSKLVVEVSSYDSAPVYFLYDRNAKEAGFLAAKFPHLTDIGEMTISRHFNYNAQDNSQVSAQLTLPRGMGNDESIPFVIYPRSNEVDSVLIRYNDRGQPVPFVTYPKGSALTKTADSFDLWVQYFVSRGWGVLTIDVPKWSRSEETTQNFCRGSMERNCSQCRIFRRSFADRSRSRRCESYMYCRCRVRWLYRAARFRQCAGIISLRGQH